MYVLTKMLDKWKLKINVLLWYNMRQYRRDKAVETRHNRVFDMTATRRQAREWAIQMLTAADLNPPENVDLFIETFWDTLATYDENEGGILVKGKIRGFSEERVRGVLAEQGKIDETLERLLDNWELNRLGTVERAVLRMGVWELSHTDVPPPVVLNEAVDLVNWFSTPKSRAIVNGVLDKYAKNLAAGESGK